MEINDEKLIAGTPKRVFLELTDACNLRCSMCPSGKKKFKSTSLDFSLSCQLLEYFSNDLPILHLYEWGEPLLYRDIRGIIEKAVALNFRTRLSSNLYNVKEDLLTFLASSGLNRIRISMDAATESTYSIIRRGSSFSEVVRNIKFLLEERNRLGVEKPQIELAFIVMKQNQSEIKDFRDLGFQLGVDRIRFKTLVVFHEEDRKLLPDDASLHSYKENSLIPRQVIKSCIMPFEGCLIGSDGQVYPCGYVKACNLDSFGNLYKQSFKEIWNGPQAIAMRKKMLEDASQLEPCRRCPHSMHPLRDKGLDIIKFND
jgi:radical SAM protein with 4Fe4S-binding SPASM domain